jgi:signal transduction histidine kinase/ActR/RegA family two-component response regulator
VRKDGSRFAASVAITLRRGLDGSPVGYLLISKDITEQKALEEQLRRKNEELEEQYRRVQEANRLKSEFLANMSHELRTPLNAIIGFTELMHDEKVGPVSVHQKEYLGDVLASARHLLQLINDVLDLAKVESGKMEFRPEPVDLAKLVQEVRDILRTLTASKRMRIETEMDPAVGGVVIDPAKFKQVLYNFVSNALKFTPEEGRVSIRILSEGSQEFRLEVEDTGIGIRPEDLGRLFVEFQQLDSSTTKKYPGTGLGLALTKRIVEAQGGAVGVRSAPGKGSLFFAVLGRELGEAHPQENPQERPVPPPARAGLGSILVVEDNPSDGTWLVKTLSGAGYVVTAVETGGDAIGLCREQVFDAITLDLLLPDMSGREVLSAIRARGPNRTTPVVVVTVVADKGLGVGFAVHDILPKPVSAGELLASLQAAGLPPGENHTVLVVDDTLEDRKLA